jgi:hypothetical protein
MKKIFLTFILLTNFLLSSCSKEISNPYAEVKNTIDLSSPTSQSSFVLNPNLPNSIATTIKWSSADFGYSASVKYILQIVKATDSFDAPQAIPLGTFNENSNTIHEYDISNTILNLKLKNAGGTIGISDNFKIRIYAQPASQQDSSLNALRLYSQETIFNSNVYDPIDETPKIVVPGNFGAASTYDDFNINLLGTSNSPSIFSPAKDRKYSGFVWMNNPAPQFKFANPDNTNFNIKGLNMLTSTVSDLTSGTLKDVSDINDPSNVKVPAGTANNSGAGTYYVTADLIANKYTIIKRKFSVTGQATANQPKVLDFVTDPNSPYYRMYINTNVTLSAGFFKISLKTSGFAAAADNFGTPIAGVNQVLAITPNSTSTINNKLSIGGGFYNNQNPGNYTIVLDTKNSANYNLRVIPN